MMDSKDIPLFMRSIPTAYLPAIYAATDEYLKNHPEMVRSPMRMQFEELRDAAEVLYEERRYL